MSDFHVEVVRLQNVQKHPNADTLSIGEARGQPIIFRTGDYAEGDLAVYIPVDGIVPDTEEFAFLKGHRRIRAAKLRGVFSMGLLARPRAGMSEGDDVREAMGVEKYDRDAAACKTGVPGGSVVGGDSEPDPGFLPEYTDIEGYRRWRGVLQDGEPVVLTEKVHGASARFVWRDGRLWVGSRHQIKAPPGAQKKVWRVTADRGGERVPVGLCYSAEEASARQDEVNQQIIASEGASALADVRVDAEYRESPPSAWWKVALELDLGNRLARAPGIAVYGEIYGQVQDLKYGKSGVELVLFDALDTVARRYLDRDEFLAVAALVELPTAPVLHEGPWSTELLSHAEGLTVIGGGSCVREGFVVKPIKERHDASRGGLGRVILKAVGESYLLRKGA